MFRNIIDRIPCFPSWPEINCFQLRHRTQTQRLGVKSSRPRTATRKHPHPHPRARYRAIHWAGKSRGLLTATDTANRPRVS